MLIRGLIGILWGVVVLGAQSKTQDDAEDDLLSLLQGGDTEDVEEVPREMYAELGFADGKFHGRKIKRIVKAHMEKGGLGQNAGLEKVLEAHDVESIQKIKNIKKIISKTRIDDDLAEKMKKEIREGVIDSGSSADDDEMRPESENTGQLIGSGHHKMKDDSTNDGDSSVIQDPASLAGKVDRILKMFNASDLDDIIKVIPVSSMKKIVSKKRVTETEDNNYDGFDSNEIKDEDDNYFRSKSYKRRSSEFRPGPVPDTNFQPSQFNFQEFVPEPKLDIVKFETENDALKELDDEIEAISANLLSNAKLLNRERDFQEVLAKMYHLQKEKLRMIEEVMKDHRENEINLSKKDLEIHETLKEQKLQKIAHLKKLQGLAEEHINEIGEEDTNGYNSKVDIDLPTQPGNSFRSIIDSQMETEANGALEQELTNDGTPMYIDPNKYDKLKRIKSIQKIKSILELTPDQAERLAEWQNQRNQAT